MLRKQRGTYIGFNGSSEGGMVSGILNTFLEILRLKGVENDIHTFFVAEKMALDEWKKIKNQASCRGLPMSILKLLCSSSKKDVIKICKNLVITREEFADWVMIFANQYGYSHLLEKKEFLPDRIQSGELPTFIHYSGHCVVRSGCYSNLSDKQLISVIKNRKRIHVHFFERNQELHCFYFTFSDMQGAHWNNPHLHYVSNLWGYSKLEIRQKLLIDRRHTSIGEHIRFYDV